MLVLRGRRGNLIKLLWWRRDGLCLSAKRLERGHLIWPQASHDAVELTPAQLSVLREGMAWRTWKPASALSTRLAETWRTLSPVDLPNDIAALEALLYSPKARRWCHVRDDKRCGYTTPPACMPDRKGSHPQTCLANVKSVLQADAHAGFNAP